MRLNRMLFGLTWMALSGGGGCAVPTVTFERPESGDAAEGDAPLEPAVLVEQCVPDVSSAYGPEWESMSQRALDLLTEQMRQRGVQHSAVIGWGCVENHLNLGLMGGDGWQDPPHLLDRDAAMTIAAAGPEMTRFESDVRHQKERMMRRGLDPLAFDGLLVLDVETWNRTLMAKATGIEVPQGIIYDTKSWTVTVTEPYLAEEISDPAERAKWLAIHPYAVDTNADSAKDAVIFTRDDVIAETIRMTRKWRAEFPNAKLGWYDFPTASYWADELDRQSADAWTEALAQLHAAGALDFLAPNVYDHYSHLVRFPDLSDSAWAREQAGAKARDEERHGRKVRLALEIGKHIGIPTWLYCWHNFHNDGKCERSGRLIPDQEIAEHLGYLMSVEFEGTSPAGVIWWGADAYLWQASDCARDNFEAYMGTTDAEFWAWQTRFYGPLMDIVREAMR